ncbi:MAG: malto-oligosyltrehalose trehalohydrolase [Candidatus Cyclobacteriaceae bacterium M2_1C_046]
MNKTDQRTIGINFKDKQADISVWAPLIDDLSLKKENGSTVGLSKNDFGYWKASTDQLQPGDKYKFLINGEKELPDPASLFQPEGVHGFSEAVDLGAHKWKDDKYEVIPLDEYIIYELHTGTFTPEGTFSGIEKKLEYLKEVGINVIEIMPVAQFPGNRNWGYDGVHPFAVQNSYGGYKGLQKLVDTCHQHGIAVILDVVYNHLGPEGNYLNEYGPYFTDKYNTPWGKAINFDDAWCDGVRNYVIENVLMWFRDFHIDALRLDAVHAIKDFSPTHILKEIKLNVDELMERTGRSHYLIVENDLNDTRFINPVKKGGFGMDAQWIDEFHHALRVTAGQERSGYYADFEGINHLAKSYEDAYVYDKIYSPHRHRIFGTKSEENPGEQFIVFSQNHDQVGNRMLGERTSHLVSFEMQKLMTGAVIVSPFLPMLFMGEEWGSRDPFQYFVSHTDPDLVEAVRKGRKAEFADFHAEGEAPDPQSEETFKRSSLNWEDIDQQPHQTMRQYYIKLLNVRRLYNSLKIPNRKKIKVSCDEQKKIITLHRWHEKEHALVFMNFSQEKRIIRTPEQKTTQWTKILDSADPVWNGSQSAPIHADGASDLTLQPESILIYSNTNEV